MTGSAEGDERVRQYRVPEMDCASCASKVTSSVERLDGIVSVDAQPATGRLVVTTRADAVDDGSIRRRIEAAGYAVTPTEGQRALGSPREVWRSKRGVGTLVGAVGLAVGMVLHFVTPAIDPQLFELLGRQYRTSHVLFVASAAIAGAPIVRNGYYSARNYSLDIDFLMTAGIVGSVATHHPFEGAMLAVLFSTAVLLERFSMDRARGSLRELMELSPETATVRRDGEEVTVPATDVAVGETVILRPGEKIPTDGIVAAGSSAVDQAPITGESTPVDKIDGDDVYAGTINEGGYLEIEATTVADESTIARIVRLVEDAQSEKTEREQFVDRLASVYTPIVVAIALSVMVVPPLAFGWAWNTWFLRGLTLLVIACPCAFVISTPVSVVSGITSAARNGVLIKSGRYLEAVSETRVVAIDKTGTLTTGELTVTDVVPLNGTSEGELLARAAAVERRSEHPIGAAIVDRAESHPEASGAFDVDAFESHPGEGVSATLDGTIHYVGKPALFEELSVDLRHAHAKTDGGEPVTQPPEGCGEMDCLDVVEEAVPPLQSAGKTVILVGTGERLLGVIAIADQPRPEAEWTVSRLREQDIRVVMLTGDNRGTARAIADAVGIEEYHAELLPEEKLNRIEQLEADHGPVTMVGDGVNDAPALAVSSVGVAMGAAGTDTALETADIALMSDDLSRLPYLYRLSRGSNRVIRQNVWSSLGMKAVLAIGAPFGIVTVIHAVLIGDMGMSLAVTGNAMRLSDVEPETPDQASP